MHLSAIGAEALGYQLAGEADLGVRLARTIAVLPPAEQSGPAHLAEAL